MGWVDARKNFQTNDGRTSLHPCTHLWRGKRRYEHTGPRPNLVGAPAPLEGRDRSSLYLEADVSKLERNAQDIGYDVDRAVRWPLVPRVRPDERPSVVGDMVAAVIGRRRERSGDSLLF